MAVPSVKYSIDINYVIYLNQFQSHIVIDTILSLYKFYTNFKYSFSNKKKFRCNTERAYLVLSVLLNLFYSRFRLRCIDHFFFNAFYFYNLNKNVTITTLKVLLVYITSLYTCHRVCQCLKPQN